MTKYLSDKLTIISTILMIMVVRIHANYCAYPGISQLDMFIFNFFSSGYNKFAVPMFFCISGYLFARNITCWKDCAKLKKKVRTLVIPYILWNLIFAMYYVVMDIIPGVSQCNNHPKAITHLFHEPLFSALSDLFIKPFAYQLWFLRDLIAMFVFAPLLWWIAKKKWWIAIILSICIVPLYTHQIYFWMGIIIATQKWDISAYRHPWWIMVGSVLVFLVYNIYCSLDNKAPTYISVIMAFCGMCIVWTVYDAICKGECYSQRGLWKHICGYSFFLYCCHEPALQILKKSFPVIFGHGNLTLVIIYFMIVWILVTIAILIAKGLERVAPRVYHILSGGR